ncbi:hypothetical protein FisN_8Hh075 [Fistulifera solaris]|uniref:Homeobox domain-containing protein n=1 Tax=Fistulifera solaris TaxID=1519565 RepID=A0A1Z5JJB8_FISSO|nr:hypothetical protein FisN_8Hh075 [Fistulifera solaris]|eukprot:GAX14089.1 hypothetical protein FisN_8Hh075 [Fistulifera solaris]
MAGDDLDLMLQHECFPTMVELTLLIQQGYQAIRDRTGRTYTSQQKLPKSSLTLDETMKATLHMQQKLLSNPKVPRTVVRRRQYPITDAIIDDSLRILRREYDDIQNYEQDPKAAQSVHEPSLKKKGSKKEAIAIKYAKWQTDILMKWMVDHSEEPFPDQTAIAQLMSQTGLSQSQVVNWTTNVRKRNKKATCQGGKKPHHFIDFMFLVQEREQQHQLGPPRRKKLATPASRRAAAMVSPSSQCSANSFPLEDDDVLLIEDPETELMQEFASTWLKNEQESTEPWLVDEDVPLGDAFEEFMAETYQPPHLLPSVTDDSTEQDMVGLKRSRSFDIDDSEVDSDFEEWVQSFDLNEMDLEMEIA